MHFWGLNSVFFFSAKGEEEEHELLEAHLKHTKRVILNPGEKIHAYVCSSPFFAFVTQDPTADCVCATRFLLLIPHPSITLM